MANYEVRARAICLFGMYFPARTPDDIDLRQVAKYCVDKNRMGLLYYAFEKAAMSKKDLDWRYIDGIMERLAARNIVTIEQARIWDEERPDINSNCMPDLSESAQYAQMILDRKNGVKGESERG